MTTKKYACHMLYMVTKYLLKADHPDLRYEDLDVFG